MEPLFKPAKPNWPEVGRRVTRKMRRQDRPISGTLARRVYIGDVLSKKILDAIVAVFAKDKARAAARKAKAEQAQA